MNAGSLNKDVLYPIKAFMAEDDGYDYIRIQHKANNEWKSSWNGMLQNLETGTLLLQPSLLDIDLNNSLISNCSLFEKLDCLVHFLYCTSCHLASSITHYSLDN